MEKISVIVPVYKVEKYLRQCLDSIVDQTYRDLEIILIDDGSPDRCGEICDEYAASDPRIRVIHKNNEGLAAARNDGIRAATGDWIAFVDSDDWCDLDYYEKLLTAMDGQKTDIFWAGGGLREYENGCRTIVTVEREFYYDDKTSTDHLMARCLRFGPPWDKLFRTAFLRENGLLFDTNDRANEDVWFNFVAHDLARRVGGCTVIGYHWRMVQTSITQGYDPQKPAICYRLIEKCDRYMQNRAPSEEIQRAIETRCFKQLMKSFKCTWFNPLNKNSPAQIKADISEACDWPYYKQAIHSKNNEGLTWKRRVVKYLLQNRWYDLLWMGHRIKSGKITGGVTDNTYVLSVSLRIRYLPAGCTANLCGGAAA